MDLDRDGAKDAMTTPTVGENATLDDVLDDDLFALRTTIGSFEASLFDQAVSTSSNIGNDLEVSNASVALMIVRVEVGSSERVIDQGRSFAPWHTSCDARSIAPEGVVGLP